MRKKGMNKPKFKAPRATKEPTIVHIKGAINELNRTIRFKPAIHSYGTRSELIANIMNIQEQLDIDDSKILRPATNWTLMKVGIEGWRSKTEEHFPNPFMSMTPLEIEAYSRLNKRDQAKKLLRDKVHYNPLSMTTWNCFIEEDTVNSVIVFQYMSDPSQSYQEVIRKVREQGYTVNDLYAINNIGACKKALRYLQLYQGYGYGMRKRYDMSESERKIRNRKLYNPVLGSKNRDE